MKNPKRSLYASYGIAIVFVLAGGAYVTANARTAVHDLQQAQVELKAADESDSLRAVDVNKNTTSVDNSTADVNEPAAQATTTGTSSSLQSAAQTKTEPQDGGHIPFTNAPVTPGDPSSYVGTVGQCPFYEMAGDKGCVPPADIECNADWSVCTYKGYQSTDVTNQAAPQGEVPGQ